jgi:hypothetical protein
LPRSLLAILAILTLASCGAPHPDASPAQTGQEDTRASAPARSGPVASPDRPDPIGDMPDYPDLPTPVLTDGRGVAAALRDPGTVDQAVVSFLADAGIGIYHGDGTPVRVGNERSPDDLTLPEDAVHGLIEMGRADAEELAAGGTPSTLGDFATAVATLAGDAGPDDLLDRFAGVYRDAPDAFMPELTADIDLRRPDTPVNRVILWAMLIDGFVPPSADLAGLAEPYTRVAAAPAALPTPGMPIGFVQSPVGGIDVRDFAMILAWLPGEAYAIPFELERPSSVHEGHGGPGPTVDLRAWHSPWYAPPPTAFSYGLTLPPGGPGLSGLPVMFDVSPSDGLSKHGTVASPGLGIPIRTDNAGQATLSYQVRKEDADGQGEERSDVVVVQARVSLAELVAAHYVMDPILRSALIGDRVVVATMQIDWHELGDWIIDQPSGGGRIQGLKCHGPGGDWVVHGTYSQATIGPTVKGNQEWVITIDKDTLKGTYRYHDDQSFKVKGIKVTTIADILGNARLTIDPTSGEAIFDLRETVHVITSKTSVGGKGSESNAPLQQSSMKWAVTDTCP